MDIVLANIIINKYELLAITAALNQMNIIID